MPEFPCPAGLFVDSESVANCDDRHRAVYPDLYGDAARERSKPNMHSDYLKRIELARGAPFPRSNRTRWHRYECWSGLLG